MYFDGSVHIEDDDQCNSCEHFLKGVNCPLLEALAYGVVTLEEEVCVRNCGFYKPYQRHLKVVHAPPKISHQRDVAQAETQDPAQEACANEATAMPELKNNDS